MARSGSGRVGGAGGCPTVRAGIVSSASVQIDSAASTSAPDDHFTASPHCRVTGSGSGRVGGAGGCPRIINASVWDGRYDGKGIATSHRCDWLPFLVFDNVHRGAVNFIAWLGLALKFSEQPHILVLIDKLDFFDATKPSCVSEFSVSP